MGKSVTPVMDNEDNSTNDVQEYTNPGSVKGQTPPMTNIKASTNLTVEYQS